MTQSTGAMSISDFCDWYGVGRSRTYEMIADGTLAAKKFGAKTLIDRVSAETWYANLPGFSGAARAVKMREKIAKGPLLNATAQ